MIYTCTFAFAGSSVLLIRKARPAWQAGLLNGIGGKVRPREGILAATIREFKEETGLWEHQFPTEPGPGLPAVFHAPMWPAAHGDHKDYPLVYFSAFILPPVLAARAVDNTLSADEPCVIWPVEKIKTAPCIGNIPYLIEMARYLTFCTPEERALRQHLIFDPRTMQECTEFGETIE